MDKAEMKRFGKPDEVREFPKGRLELVKIGGATIGGRCLSPGGDGPHRFNRSSRPRVVTRPTFNIMCQGSCGSAWTTGASSIVGRGMCRCSRQATTRGS